MAKKKEQTQFALPTLMREQAEQFTRYIDRKSMTIGIYNLPAGSEDTQTPHNEDEAYYVLTGKGAIEIEGASRPVEVGDLIFVPAKAEHRFKDIERDLSLLVFFAPQYTG